MARPRNIRAVLWDTSGLLYQNGGSEAALPEFIRALRPRYRTVLLGLSWQDLRQTLVEHWETADAFDELVLSLDGEDGVLPQTYTQAIGQLALRPSEAVVIDCSSDHCVQARSAGLNAIEFQTPAQVGSDLFNLIAKGIRQ